MTITGDTTSATFEAAWNDWHAGRERYYGDPLGWVSIVGLYWLTEEFETVADLPGRWRADADTVYVEGIDGIERLEPGEGAPGLYVEAGDRRIEVIRRTGTVALRVHDPKSPHLEQYDGIPAYAPDEQWRVHGTFTPFQHPKTRDDGCRRRRSRAPPRGPWRHRFRTCRRRSSTDRLRAPGRFAARAVHRRHQRCDDLPWRQVTFDIRTDTPTGV